MRDSNSFLNGTKEFLRRFAVEWRFLVALFIVVLGLEAYLALRFYQLNVFNYYNVLFDTDPNTRLNVFAHGWGGRSLFHPNLGNYFAPLLRVMSKVASLTGLIDNQQYFREIIALFIVPLFTAIKTMAIYLISRLLNISIFNSFFVALIAAFSFSQIIYGSVPDHFGLTGAVLAILFLYAIMVLRNPSVDSIWVWGVIGCFFVGITISNSIFFGLIFWATRWALGKNWFKSLTEAIFISSIIIILSLLLFYISTLFLSRSELDLVMEHEYTQYFIFANYLQKLVAYPVQVWLTFVPLVPSVIENELALINGSTNPIQFTYEFIPLIGYGSAILVVMTYVLAKGLIDVFKRDLIMRALGFAALGIILFNGFFHAAYGSEFYLFSQHWHVPVILLLVIWLQRLDDQKVRMYLMIGLSIMLSLDLYVVNQMLQELPV